MKRIIKTTTVLLAFILFILFSAVIYYSAKLPDNYYFNDKNSKELKISSAPGITISSNYSSLTAASGSTVPAAIPMKMMFMDIIPVKDVEAGVIDVPMLTPCGMPFGIKMLMDGVMIIKTGDIITSSGYVSPAGDAGIKSGDIVKAINNTSICSNKDIESVISELDGQKINISIIRSGIQKEISVTPAYSSEDGKYKLGIWVRDSSAGIGTVTYYDNDSGTFGGLGHPVCDSDTGQIIPLSSGEVMDVCISGVKKGIPGTPGELQGFFTDHDSCGKLYLNNRYGVFGTIDDDYDCCTEIPMALKHEIEKGPAVIYSTLNGSKPEKFNIEIKEINYDTVDSSKNMVIEITDRKLLSKTGGIVQGMSGSPIIQNDKLVGAVTHVFVNDPTSGYAIFCESMYEMSKVS